MKKVTSLVVALMALTCLSCCSTKKEKTNTAAEKKQETVISEAKPKEEKKSSKKKQEIKMSAETLEALKGKEGLFAVLQTEKGQFLRFYLKEIPEKKKNAIGVIGIRLNEGDAVSNVYVLDAGDNYKVEYNDRVIELRKVKTARRGTKGTKVRGGKSDS